MPRDRTCELSSFREGPFACCAVAVEQYARTGRREAMGMAQGRNIRVSNGGTTLLRHPTELAAIGREDSADEKPTLTDSAIFDLFIRASSSLFSSDSKEKRFNERNRGLTSEQMRETLVDEGEKEVQKGGDALVVEGEMKELLQSIEKAQRKESELS